MNSAQKIIYSVVALLLIGLHTWFGMQVNFCHIDYHQIYLIGLDFVSGSGWEFWGPDVVWSDTRLAGGMQGLLVGLPILLTNNYISPLIVSNLISGLGLVIISLYISYRLKISYLTVLISVFCLPFLLIHGSVLLNTAYLLLPGAILLVSVAELFLYTQNTILKNKSWYFLGLGASIFFVYQLHLTYVCLLPFVCVLLLFEYQRDRKSLTKHLSSLFVGLLIGGLTLFPTWYLFPKLAFVEAGGNLNFRPEKALKFFELATRMLNYATLDISPTVDYLGFASAQSKWLYYLLYAMKCVGVAQILFMVYVFWLKRKETLSKKIVIVFFLSFLMCLFLQIIANKHLESRTYILLYAIPVFAFFYAIHFWASKSWFNPLILGICSVCMLAYTAVGIANTNKYYSFGIHKTLIEKAIKHNKPSLYTTHRVTRYNQKLSR